MTKKQYSKPQLIEIGDAIVKTLRRNPHFLYDWRGRRFF